MPLTYRKLLILNLHKAGFLPLTPQQVAELYDLDWTRFQQNLRSTRVRLFVGNLNYNTTREQLEDHFLQSDDLLVTEAIVIIDKENGRGKGFGFVEVDTQLTAQQLFDKFNGTELQGRKLTVNEARPPQDRRGGSHGGGKRDSRDTRDTRGNRAAGHTRR